MTTQTSDRAVAASRRAVVDALYRRHAPAVRRYAVRRVGNDAADDVVATVFAAVLTTGSATPDVDAALPWLYTIARHVTVKVQRADARRSDAATAWRASEAASPETSSSDPGERLAGDALVAAVFADLGDDAAELLRLIVWEDLDIAVAARVLGINPGTARVRLHRIRKAVQRRWSSYHTESDIQRPERGGAST